MHRSLIVIAFAAATANAQSGSFVATLGRDTVHLERFSRKGNVLDGVIVTRVQDTRIVKYKVTYRDGGGWSGTSFRRPTRTESPSATTAHRVRWSMSAIRSSDARSTKAKTLRLASPRRMRSRDPSIPLIRPCYDEEAFATARRRVAKGLDSSTFLLTMFTAQKEPQKSRIWFVGTDSAELNYFNVARSGYRFDDKGKLIRADWTGTTYRYQIKRGPDVDVESFARRWAEDDKRGAGIGALSPRDTSRATVGGATVTVEYSRPAARGRNIWGDVVRFDRVWRLGADMATHFATTSDLTIGGTKIPADATRSGWSSRATDRRT
jgi:hypothetical protein